MENIFLCGAAYGIIVGGILGVILSQIRAARTRMGAQNRSLDSFPNVLQPDLTPARIVRRSRMAMFSCIFWFGLLIIAIIAAFYTYKILVPYVIGTL